MDTDSIVSAIGVFTQVQYIHQHFNEILSEYIK